MVEVCACYEELFAEGLAAEDTGETGASGATGDLIRVGLRDDYEQFDFEWPMIVREAEEELEDVDIDISTLQPFTAFPLDKLRQFLAIEGETFISQEALSKTQFGRSSHKEMPVPNLQINEARMIAVVDMYIRTRLFGQPFNPFNGSDWKILLSKDAIVTKHIIEEMARSIFNIQNNIMTTDAQVVHTKFSSVTEIKMRESYSIEIHKAIYERLGYPTSRGGFEKSFMEFLDRDGEVERFLKINESQHPFAVIYYMWHK